MRDDLSHASVLPKNNVCSGITSYQYVYDQSIFYFGYYIKPKSTGV